MALYKFVFNFLTLNGIERRITDNVGEAKETSFLYSERLSIAALPTDDLCPVWRFL